MTTRNAGHAAVDDSEAIVRSDLRFPELCRIARLLLDVPAASLRLSGEAGSWTDLDPAADPDFRRAVTAQEGWPPSGSSLVWCGDTREDRAFAAWSATHGPGIRFLARIPFGPDDMGCLTVLGPSPRAETAEGVERLTALAALADQALRLSHAARRAVEREAAFRLLAEMSTDTIIRGNLEGVRLYVSPSIRNLLGYEPEELVGQKAIAIAHPDDAPAFKRFMEGVREARIDVAVIELRLQHKNGAWIWMEASLRLTHDPVTGVANGYVVSVRDVGKRKALEARLEHLASFDTLTGLPNRMQFGQSLIMAIERARLGRVSVALFYMDLDRFKAINDTLGHEAGDFVLQTCAARLRTVLRGADVVARLGGDEFTALLARDRSELSPIAERLVAAIGEPIAYKATTLSVGLSIGIACTPQDADRPDALLSAADQALYRAKAAGRNTFRFFGKAD
ncbi:diguanylate cyclase domain-containing protein [Methylobacterium sp. Leaf118]|uniref:diguanylate cyclase domain-containing protein n=1 Tax=Methylobacterium sp. Leaf118 TaxID=2876562 RepID=UPI001E58EEE7|nr:diguanylate cyclase [Methylobacterium sp. Leaf118]